MTIANRIEIPTETKHYLAYHEKGQSLRQIARTGNCHPSTILRQIRKIEAELDDPLFDKALNRIREGGRAQFDGDLGEIVEILDLMTAHNGFLLVADQLEKAALIDPQAQTGLNRSVPREHVEFMRLQLWITPGRAQAGMQRYGITAAGRAWLDGQKAGDCSSFEKSGPLHEPPLKYLSRRFDKHGAPWLSGELVHAGEQLREDYELAQLAEDPVTDFESVIQKKQDVSGKNALGHGPEAAKERFLNALHVLGPGLGDVALRCCCFQEGLEQTEAHMGWTARSGKIVLRIALQRLALHYRETLGRHGPLIG